MVLIEELSQYCYHELLRLAAAAACSQSYTNALCCYAQAHQKGFWSSPSRRPFEEEEGRRPAAGGAVNVVAGNV